MRTASPGRKPSSASRRPNSEGADPRRGDTDDHPRDGAGREVGELHLRPFCDCRQYRAHDCKCI